MVCMQHTAQGPGRFRGIGTKCTTITQNQDVCNTIDIPTSKVSADACCGISLVTPSILRNPIPLKSISTITNYPSPAREQAREVAHEIVIFFGACSGVVLGKVTVRTPFSMDALISSGCETASQHAILQHDWEVKEDIP